LKFFLNSAIYKFEKASLSDPNNPAGGVKLYFMNGDTCNGLIRQTIIDFPCASGTSSTFTISENPPCTFNIRFPTSAACPGGSKPMPCQATLEGQYYDLSPLTGVDYRSSPTGDNFNYFMNVCGSVSVPNCQVSNNVFVCQLQKYQDQFQSVIAFSSIDPSQFLWSLSNPNNPKGGVKLTTTNGNACYNQNGTAMATTAVIDFPCASGIPNNFLIFQQPLCQYNIIFPSAFGCPTNPPRHSLD